MVISKKFEVFLLSWSSPGAAIDAAVGGWGSTRTRWGGWTAHLSSHVRRDVGALLNASIETEPAHVELVCHAG